MSISTLQNQIVVGGNGSATSFSFPFVGDSAQSIQVVYTNASGAETTLLPTSYTVALNPIAPGELWSIGGTVTYPLSGSPIANGTSLTISRILPLTQETDLNNQGNVYPAVVEEALDTLTMQMQQTAARTGLLRGTWIPNAQYNYADMVVDGVNGANTGNIYSCGTANISGVWATDLANGLWTLALNVAAIVNSLPSIPNNNLFGNISGISATPVGVGGSAFLDAVFGNAQGSMLYRGASTWTVLTPGINGQVLTTQGAGANPSWANASSGTITGVAAGTGLTGGGSSGSVALALSTVATNTVLANVSGGTAAPGATTPSALFDTVFGNAQGNILFRSGTGWTVLAPGPSGQVLQTLGAGQNPVWGLGPSVWGLVTGTTLTASTGISTVTNALTGKYVINFSASYGNTNYLVLITPQYTPSVGAGWSVLSKANGSVTIGFTDNGAFVNVTNFSIVIFT